MLVEEHQEIFFDALFSLWKISVMYHEPPLVIQMSVGAEEGETKSINIFEIII